MAKEVVKKNCGSTKCSQWMASAGVALLTMQSGLLEAWSSPYVAVLTGPNSPIPVTQAQISLVVAFPSLGKALGALSGIILMNYMGSKTMIITASIPITCAWLLLIPAKVVNWILLSRFLGGFTAGLTWDCFAIYMGEIADPSIRGALIAIAVMGFPLGNIAMSIMGAFLPIPVSSGICSVLSMCIIYLFLFFPESPHHLIKKKLDTEAISSIQWYHRGCDAHMEFKLLKEFIATSEEKSFLDMLKEFRIPVFKKAFTIALVLLFYTQLGGYHNVMFYMETILQEAKVSIVRPANVVIFIMLFSIFSSSISMILIDNYGRKFLMITSASLSVVSFCLLGLHFQLLYFNFDPEKIQFISIVAFIGLYVSMYVGIFPVTYAILGEIFPPNVKYTAACLGVNISAIAGFFCLVSFQLLVETVTSRYVYFIFAAYLATAIPFTMFFLPETKQKTLQEIQATLTGL